MEKQLQMARKQEIFNQLAEQHRDSIITLRKNRDQVSLQALQDELVAITEQKAAENPASLSPEHISTASTPSSARLSAEWMWSIKSRNHRQIHKTVRSTTSASSR